MRLAKKIFIHFHSDSLYRNSIYLMMSTFVMAFFGFFFWIINARLFPPEQIGIATTMISVTSLITSFSLLGFNNSLIRYLPKSNHKNEEISTSFTVVAIISFLIGCIFILGINFFSPRLSFIKNDPIYAILFIFMMPIFAVNNVSDNIFIAFRSTKYILYYDFALSIVKLLLPFFLISLFAVGVYLSVTVATITALILTFYYLYKNFHYVYLPSLNFKVLKKTIKFSLGNYLGNFLNSLPTLLLPIIITNNVGPKESAFFYIDMMIANLIYFVPKAVAQSLFAEGSHNETKLKENIKKSLKIIYLILVFLILFLIIFGRYILLAFGKQYSVQGFNFLELLVISSLFISVNTLIGIFFQIKQRLKKIIFINLLGAITILVTTYLLTSKGLVGIGVAWLSSQIFIMIVYIVMLIDERK